MLGNTVNLFSQVIVSEGNIVAAAGSKADDLGSGVLRLHVLNFALPHCSLILACSSNLLPLCSLQSSLVPFPERKRQSLILNLGYV